jgi:hypothetical protein
MQTHSEQGDLTSLLFIFFQNEKTRIKIILFWNVTPCSLVEVIEDQYEIKLL